MKGTYIFTDVKDNTPFKKDCDNLLNLLGELITPHKHLISNGNPPHITLGYVKEPQKVESIINSVNNVPSTILKKVEVSPAGVHGTVICKENPIQTR